MGSHSHGKGEGHVLPRPPAVGVRCGPVHGPGRDHHAPCLLSSPQRALRSRKQVPPVEDSQAPDPYRHVLVSWIDGRPQGPSGVW